MDEALKMTAVERCKAEFKTAWDKCDHMARFETWADLYYRRFGRLSPGKSEAPETGRYSNDAENRALCDAWHSTGLAAHDAIMWIVTLERIRERSGCRIDELEDTITELERANAAFQARVDELEGEKA